MTMTTNNQKKFILSDRKGIGKTTSLQKWIIQNPNVKGFLSPVVEGKRVFQIIETNNLIPMETENEDLEIGRYKFDQKSFQIVEEIVLNSFLEGSNQTIIIDEIGPLEINKNKGFHNLVLKLTTTQADNKSHLFFVVRESCLNSFIEKYKLSNTEVFNLEEFNYKFLINK